MTVVIVPVGPQYIKKEDAANFFKNHLRGQIIIGIVYSALPIFFITVLAGKISGLSNLIGPTDFYLYTGTALMILGVLGYWAFMAKSFSKEYKDEFYKKLEKYDDKEMIGLNSLVDSKRYWKGIGVYMAGFAIGLIFYLLPIFQVME